MLALLAPGRLRPQTEVLVAIAISIFRASNIPLLAQTYIWIYQTIVYFSQ